MPLRNGIHLEVYTLADPSQASDVVESVLHLVNDHKPKPMMNGKPVEKNPTAVDKLDKQQTEYESRGENKDRIKQKNPTAVDKLDKQQTEYESRGENKDRIKQVHEHNSGYPQLRDEMEKRRSCTRVRLFEIPADKREHGRTGIRNRSRRIKNPRRKEKKPKRRYRSRITKNRKRFNKAKLRNAIKYTKPKGFVCTDCGCYVDTGLSRRCTSNSNPASTSSMERCNSHHTRDTISNLSHRYPEPSEVSKSSYHSFYSSDNEPME